MAWVNRLCRLAPVTAIAMELVRFDMQAMENPEISGVEYQQGTLAGYEVREYLLEKWQRTCAYCGAQHVPLEIEHITPRSKGGSDRVSNLTLACRPCNQKKGNQPLQAFLAHDPKRLAKIKAHAKAPLKDAAAVNSTRWALYRRLQATGLPVITGSGGRTKYNRQRLGIPKTHALDAACVGPVTAITHWNVPTLTVRATGRGRYQRTRLNRFGFPRGYLMRHKQVKGFQTGDLVQAQVPTGKKKGRHLSGPGRHPRYGQFQHPDPTGCGSRHFPPPLPSAATGGRLWLYLSTQTDTGGREPGRVIVLRTMRYPSPP